MNKKICNQQRYVRYIHGLPIVGPCGGEITSCERGMNSSCLKCGYGQGGAPCDCTGKQLKPEE